MLDQAPLASFARFIDTGRAPQRADRSAAGLLPTRAFRYCEAATTASALGWYVFPPTTFSLFWDGDEVLWSCNGAKEWLYLEAAQFPRFSEMFDRTAPERVKGYSPPFLAKLPEPGTVQVWSGLVARTRPGWGLLVRPPPNIPKSSGYELYEGVVETDRWFGPLFTIIRLTRMKAPVVFQGDLPLFLAQPIQMGVYTNLELDSFELVPNLDALSSVDWDDYHATVVAPAKGSPTSLGSYAAESRRRRRTTLPGCPVNR